MSSQDTYVKLNLGTQDGSAMDSTAVAYASSPTTRLRERIVIAGDTPGTGFIDPFLDNGKQKLLTHDEYVASLSEQILLALQQIACITQEQNDRLKSLGLPPATSLPPAIQAMLPAVSPSFVRHNGQIKQHVISESADWLSEQMLVVLQQLAETQATQVATAAALGLPAPPPLPTVLTSLPTAAQPYNPAGDRASDLLQQIADIQTQVLEMASIPRATVERRGVAASDPRAIPVSTTSVRLVDGNSARLRLTIYNSSASSTLTIKLGTGASLKSQSVTIPSLYWYEDYYYTGPVDGLWSAADATAYAFVQEIV